MVKNITINEALEIKDLIYVDVRSRSEYEEATIPGAINIPLLDDEERIQVGTVYKNKGPVEARKLGLNFVAPKLPAMVDKFFNIAERGPVMVFCWRGGWRSQSVASFLEIMGLQVYRLSGGFKAHRKFVNSFLSKPLPLKAAVLHGLTGVGKTDILIRLKNEGQAVIDLEGLAHNRGSVFGQVGMAKAPGQKKFEAELVHQFLNFKNEHKIFFIECESKRVGNIILPDKLMEAMDEGYHILLYTSKENRVKRIVDIYTHGRDKNIPDLIQGLSRLEQRLGKTRIAEFKKLVEEELFDQVVEPLLTDYYDPLYRYPDCPADGYDLCIDSSDIDKVAKELINFASIKNQII